MSGMRAMSVAIVMTLAVAVVGAQGEPKASGGWVAEPDAGASAASAYVVIENPTMYDVYVISVTTDAAGSAEIAEGAGEAAKTIKDLTVPAYGSTELTPGGVHIRLKDLKKPITSGSSIDLTLTLDTGATIKVTAPVKKG